MRLILHGLFYRGDFYSHEGLQILQIRKGKRTPEILSCGEILSWLRTPALKSSNLTLVDSSGKRF